MLLPQILEPVSHRNSMMVTVAKATFAMILLNGMIVSVTRMLLVLIITEVIHVF